MKHQRYSPAGLEKESKVIYSELPVEKCSLYELGIAVLHTKELNFCKYHLSLK